jgi:hypothetical protein
MDGGSEVVSVKSMATLRLYNQYCPCVIGMCCLSLMSLRSCSDKMFERGSHKVAVSELVKSHGPRRKMGGIPTSLAPSHVQYNESA